MLSHKNFLRRRLLGIEAGLTDTATVGAAYTGQYGGGAGHGVTAELRVAF